MDGGSEAQDCRTPSATLVRVQHGKSQVRSSAAAGDAGGPRTRRRAALPWLVGPVLLAVAVGVPAFLVRARAELLWGAVLGLLVVVPLLWIAVSALWPARAERTCPSCGASDLRRIDPTTTVGVACGACGWRDEERSAWHLAEEEGPLERIVLRQRRRRRSSRTPVDSTGGGD